jgi:hypothetical protein
VGFDEFHVNARVSYPDLIQSLAPGEFPAGASNEIRVRVASDTLPDSVDLWVRPAGARSFGKGIDMHRLQGNDYGAQLSNLDPGLYEYLVSSRTGERVMTFPGAVARQPGEWPFHEDELWSFRITSPGTTMRLFDPKVDYKRLLFVRPGEQYRLPFFQIVPGASADESALSLTLPDLGKDTPERYAASVYIGAVIESRRTEVVRAQAMEIKLRSVGGSHKSVVISLVEKDGTAWSAPVVAGREWSNVEVPLSGLHLSRSIHIPSPFPGLWNYWRESAAGRGGAGDRVHIENVERVELTVSSNAGATAQDDAAGVAIESIQLRLP